MTNPNPTTTTEAPPAPPARTHAEAGLLLRRPFAPGAIGFRAMTKVPHNGDAYGGAQVAAFIGAQSITQRLNTVCPGAWRMDFAPAPAELVPANSKKTYLACQLTITLPASDGGDRIDAVYSDIGEMDSGSFAGLKALYSDARKRAAVAAGIGAYLYTALAPVVLPIGNGPRQVQSIRRQGKSDLLIISPATEEWLRRGYEARMSTDSVVGDLGAMLSHGEPEIGMGQGEATDAATTTQEAGPAAPEPTSPAATNGAQSTATAPAGEVVPVDFTAVVPTNGASGPDAA